MLLGSNAWGFCGIGVSILVNFRCYTSCKYSNCNLFLCYFRTVLFNIFQMYSVVTPGGHHHIYHVHLFSSKCLMGVITAVFFHFTTCCIAFSLMPLLQYHESKASVRSSHGWADGACWADDEGALLLRVQQFSDGSTIDHGATTINPNRRESWRRVVTMASQP